MVRRKLMGLLVCSFVLSIATVAWAGVPSLSLSSAVDNAPAVQTLMYSVPDASGTPFTAAYASGAVETNDTVTLTLVDANGDAIFAYPFEDLWIDAESGTFLFCPGGTVADQSTDVNGQTTWTGSMFAGGEGAGLVVMVNGDPLTQGALDFLFNSADINADLAVNLSDAVAFTQTFAGGSGYSAAMDFNNDGTMNLSDVVAMAQAIGAACP